MKTKLKIVVSIVVAIVILIATIMIVSIGGAEIAEGRYEIVGYDVYPDAYIMVEENSIQFYNIDLNAIYQEYQSDNYQKMIEAGIVSNVTEEQLENMSDLNAMFVSNPYIIDYEQQLDNKSGTFTYVYFCLKDGNTFGLVLEYNSFDKTIQINSPVIKLLFER